MHRMQYASGERTFLVNKTVDLGDYYQVTDADTKVVFKLPKHVIEAKPYIFSWDRYREERDDSKLKEVLEMELERLQNTNFKNKGVLKGIEDMKRFLAEFK